MGQYTVVSFCHSFPFPLFPCSGVVLFMGWKVISDPVPKASPSSPPLCLVFTLLFCTSRVFYLLCLCGILPFPKYIFIEVPLDLVMDLPVSHSGCLESQLCPAQGSPWPFLIEKTPAASLLSAPCCYIQYTFAP